MGKQYNDNTGCNFNLFALEVFTPTPNMGILLRPYREWKTWQLILNRKFRYMSKKINQINFPSVYSVLMGEKKFLS